MHRKELIMTLKKLSRDFMNKKIDGILYAKTCESLIITNLDLVPELEDFADFLAQYYPIKDIPELYDNTDLRRKIKELFKI